MNPRFDQDVDRAMALLDRQQKVKELKIRSSFLNHGFNPDTVIPYIGGQNWDDWKQDGNKYFAWVRLCFVHVEKPSSLIVNTPQEKKHYLNSRKEEEMGKKVFIRSAYYDLWKRRKQYKKLERKCNKIQRDGALRIIEKFPEVCRHFETKGRIILAILSPRSARTLGNMEG